MSYYDVKEIKFKLKRGSSTTSSSFRGSLSSRRPKTEYEAKKQAEEYLTKRYPGWEIVDLKIEFK